MENNAILAKVVEASHKTINTNKVQYTLLIHPSDIKYLTSHMERTRDSFMGKKLDQFFFSGMIFIHVSDLVTKGDVDILTGWDYARLS